MTVNYVEASAIERQKNFDVMEIMSIAGVNSRDSDLALQNDEFNSLRNVSLNGRGFEKRGGIVDYGTAQSGTKVVGLGHHESDSGITPLMMVNQTLYKYVSNAWTASDKTDYTANLDTTILRFNSKSGSSVVTGTSTSGSTTYLIEDTTKTWTLGAYAGFCVVIEGEVKYIADNTETTLILGEKLNSNVDSDYQSKSYAIHALSPHAFILNGTDHIEKYDLTDTTEIDGTHVTNGKALPIAKVGTVHQGRMWLATGQGDENDRVFLTDVGVGENVTTDTNLNINMQFFNDGDNIVNLGSMPLAEGSACVVAKTESVHVVEGDNILNYTSRSVVERDGCYAQKSFATGRGTAFMLGKNGKVISLADTGQGPLSDPLPISRAIQDEIAALTAAEQQNASAVVYDNKYFLRVGDLMWYYDIEESITQNRHVWVDLKYMTGSVDFNVMAVINEVLYGGASDEGQAYTMFSGNDDNGDDIEMLVDSGEITFPGRPHFWVERVEIMADAQANTVLSFQSLTDGGSFGSVQSATLDNTDGRYVFNVQKRCKSFRYRISESGTEAATRIILPIRIFYRRSDSGEDATKG
jgi:hypothetical protein